MNPKRLSLLKLKRYMSSADVSISGKGALLALSTRTRIRPGVRRSAWSVAERACLTIWVETEEPVPLLLVGGRVTVQPSDKIRDSVGFRCYSTDMSVVVHLVPYAFASSSSIICTFCPLGVFSVMRWRPFLAN